jgi:hypothetical protein
MGFFKRISAHFHFMGGGQSFVFDADRKAYNAAIEHCKRLNDARQNAEGGRFEVKAMRSYRRDEYDPNKIIVTERYCITQSDVLV